MSRALDDLTPEFKPLAFELLARAVEAGIPVLIVDTLRTKAEQEANLAKGVSWTLNSKHLPQGVSQKSDAIDIVPYEQFDLHGPDKLEWAADDPAWERLGQIGERLGLNWGGRWGSGRAKPDMGHFEFRRPAGEHSA